MSRYQKGKTNLDFTEARDSEWQWHQLGHMQVCTSLQRDNHTSTPPLSFLQAGCPSCHPTNSVKALKALCRYHKRKHDSHISSLPTNVSHLGTGQSWHRVTPMLLLASENVTHTQNSSGSNNPNFRPTHTLPFYVSGQKAGHCNTISLVFASH